MHTLSQKTRELVTLAKDGDRTALNQLYKVYAERVRWIVRFRMNKELRSKLESMDLVQDTLLHALGGLDDFTYKNEGDLVPEVVQRKGDVMQALAKELLAKTAWFGLKIPWASAHVGSIPTPGTRNPPGTTPRRFQSTGGTSAKFRGLLRLTNVIDAQLIQRMSS